LCGGSQLLVIGVDSRGDFGPLDARVTVIGFYRIYRHFCFNIYGYDLGVPTLKPEVENIMTSLVLA
jgi:hypothetical protein